MKCRFSYTACLKLIVVFVAGCGLTTEKVGVHIQDVSTQSKQFGATRIDFPVAEGKGFVILPTKESADGSRPWVWYAPTFIGRHPDKSHIWMFRQLLDRGFYICGIDVGESFGSPKGRKIYGEFYQLAVREYGLAPKACLFAQSRGGLMLYNWAAENPKRVQCIVGIYPVCDIKSYPGLAKACDAYNMSESELRACLGKHNPIDRLAGLASTAVPILHIHGDADKVVPLENNSAELVQRYRSLGGRAEVIVVKGKGHEVCPEYFQSQTLVDFLLAQGYDVSSAGQE